MTETVERGRGRARMAGVAGDWRRWLPWALVVLAFTYDELPNCPVVNQPRLEFVFRVDGDTIEHSEVLCIGRQELVSRRGD